jgi:hypothetical protein
VYSFALVVWKSFTRQTVSIKWWVVVGIRGHVMTLRLVVRFTIIKKIKGKYAIVYHRVNLKPAPI